MNKESYWKNMYWKKKNKDPSEQKENKKQLEANYIGFHFFVPLMEIDSAETPFSKEEIFQQLQHFCLANSIKTEQVLAITIQKNRTTDYSSLIVDFENAQLLPNYPIEIMDDYKEKVFGDFLVCYKEGLKVIESNNNNNNNLSGMEKETDKSIPFCCERITQYKPTRIDGEEIFQNFLSGKGHHPNIIYEVKKQINNGPLLWTKYFTLIHDRREEVKGKYTQKKHAFKNYRCLSHGYFFGIDLYQQGLGSNYHHMRLNPFQKINEELLKQFFTFVNV